MALKQGSRESLARSSDAEVTLARAVWCAARHVRPEVVIETGVAHGVTSRIVLEALNKNDRGHCGAWICRIRLITGCTPRPVWR
jgi:hypothetical protein